MCLGNGRVFCQFMVCGVGLAGSWDGKILDMIILVFYLLAYFPFKELLRRVRHHFGRTPAQTIRPASREARQLEGQENRVLGRRRGSITFVIKYGQILSN